MVSVSLSAGEIKHAFVGKTCTSKAGARFTFTKDGHYAYAGLWENRGHYRVGAGAVTVLLDSGLERDFAITKRGDALYIEETALSCG